MELMVAIFVGVLTGTGIYLTLRARTFDLVLGLTLLSYAVNLLIFVMGRLTVGRPPILDGSRASTGTGGHARPSRCAGAIRAGRPSAGHGACTDGVSYPGPV